MLKRNKSTAIIVIIIIIHYCSLISDFVSNKDIHIPTLALRCFAVFRQIPPALAEM